MINNLTVLTISYHQKELVDIVIRGFEKYKPADLKITYVVVENSTDTSYKEHTESLADNVIFKNNISANNVKASLANGMGIELGKQFIKDKYVFISKSIL